MSQLYMFCRGFAAFMIMQYGFAKINGSQFTVLDSVIDKPMGEVSGFWLTWYYFGYSQAYGWIIALVQIVGGVMLLFHRTALAGAVILFGAVGNIILINLFFDIATSAMIMAFLIQAALGLILFQNRQTLLNTFWNREGVVRQVGNVEFPAWFRWSARIVIVLLPAVFTYWVANCNNRHPTSIDGSWRVEVLSSPQVDSELPDRIYFEYNRAYMSVFAYADSSATHHFIVDEEEQSLEIWSGWFKKEALLFSGSFEWEEENLLLSGYLSSDTVSTQLKLSRMRPGP